LRSQGAESGILVDRWDPFRYGPLGRITKSQQEFEAVDVRKSPWLLLIFLLIGGLLGGILGEILRVMAPQGTIQTIFATNVTPGISPPLTIDLILLKLTLGFSFKVSLLTILGMLLGIYLYKNV
jgi:hypothetical protein